MDVAVLFEEQVSPSEYHAKSLKFIDQLSQLLNREVDVVILNHASPFLKFQIFKTGERIYERRDRKDHHFEARAIMEYFDYLPVRTVLVNRMISRIKQK